MVFRDSVHIALNKAALCFLEDKAADVLNTFVMAPYREKLCTVLCPEFADSAGKSTIIVSALYGLKSAGALFRAYLAKHM